MSDTITRPERAAAPGPGPIAARGAQRAADTSLILGVVAVLLFPFALGGGAAVVVGLAALSGGGLVGHRGRGRAVAGVVLGGLTLLVLALMLLGVATGDQEIVGEIAGRASRPAPQVSVGLT